MAKEVILPKFGFTVEESTIMEWLVSEGDVVESGDPLCEVTTDKVNMEVEAPIDGIVGGIQYEAGATVPVTQIICYILAEGEAAPDAPAPAPATTTEPAMEASAAPAAKKSTPLARRVAEVEGIALKSVTGTGDGGKITRQDVIATMQQPSIISGKVRATPAARRIARTHNMDLQAIPGSGPRGRIQAADAQAAIPTVAATAAIASNGHGVTVIPYAGMRQTIGQRLQFAWQTIPHIYFSVDVDMSAVIDLRGQINTGRDKADKVSVTAILAKVIAHMLTQHPKLNARFTDAGIEQHRDVNLGLAVALDEGLIVPVVPAAQSLGIEALNEAIKARVSRARSGKLRAADLEGGTFTLSNLGMYGVDSFTAIINPPEVGILSVGRTVDRFVPDAQGQPVLRPMMTATFAVDHRAIDGAVAAQALGTLAATLATPALILM